MIKILESYCIKFVSTAFAILDVMANNIPRDIRFRFHLLIVILFSFFFISANAQKTSINSSSSVPWSDDSSWIGGVAPPTFNISGEDITIDGYITSTAPSMNFITTPTNHYLRITTNGLLVITENVSFDNMSMDIIIEPGGRLVMMGNFSTGNKIEITVHGVMVVVGNMEFGGSLSDFDMMSTGNLYVGGNIINNNDANDVDQPLEDLNDGLNHDDVFLYDLVTGGNEFDVSAVAGNTSESGANTNFNIKLKSQPTDDVTISISSNDITEGIVVPSSLLFTSSNWSVDQVVDIQGVDDDIDDDDVSYKIQLSTSSSDSDFDGVTLNDINVINLDDDEFGITVTNPVTSSTSESGSSTSFSIVLDSEPLGDVVISFDSNNLNEGVLSANTAIFTPSNWSASQVITVTGVDDTDDDGDVGYQVVFSSVSSTLDLNYDGYILSALDLINLDDDGSGITVTDPLSSNTSESGSSTSFSIVLDTEPLGDVVISFDSNNLNEGVLSSNTVTFTSGNWDVSQVITVTGVDDTVDDGDVAYQVVFSSVSSTLDANYDGYILREIDLLNLDDDTSGITVTDPLSSSTSESGSSTSFSIVLDSEPLGDVVLSFESNNLNEGVLSSNTVTFTSGNWDISQVVTITGVDDMVDDGDIDYEIVFLSVTSAFDDNYNSLSISSLKLVNLDNDGVDDLPGIIVSTMSGETNEDGGVSMFSIKLNTAPSDEVKLELSSTDETEGKVNPADIIFTPSNWSESQFVNVNGQDDDIYDGDIEYTIVISEAISLDLSYDGLDAQDVLFKNFDDDIYGVNVTTTTLETNENSFSASFSISLLSQPISDVTINFMSSDISEGVLTTQSILFNEENWSNEKTIEIIGVDDDLYDGDMEYQISFTVSSLDAQYNNIELNALKLINVDNEPSFVIPDAFSPNGDGKNDYWVIPGIDDYPYNEIRVFNRWGTEVYQVKGYDNNTKVWRGQRNKGTHKNSGEPMFTTYYYIIDLKNGSKPITGTILLSR